MFGYDKLFGLRTDRRPGWLAAMMLASLLVGCSSPSGSTSDDGAVNPHRQVLVDPPVAVTAQPHTAGDTSRSAIDPEQQAKVVVEQTLVNPRGLDDAVTSQQGSDFYLGVASAIHDEGSPTAGAPSQKQIILTVNLGNKSDRPIIVEGRSLALIALDGSVVGTTVEGSLQPQLVNAVIDGGSSFYGFVNFRVLRDFDSMQLEWCPQSEHPCRRPLIAPVP